MTRVQAKVCNYVLMRPVYRQQNRTPAGRRTTPPTVCYIYGHGQEAQARQSLSMRCHNIAFLESDSHGQCGHTAEAPPCQPGEDRIHSIQQLSVTWEENQCVRGRSPSQSRRSNRERCAATGQPSSLHQGNSHHSVMTSAFCSVPSFVGQMVFFLFHFMSSGVCQYFHFYCNSS